jgi:response regulator RpfG family c-di-GMP phosphodiesterase
MENLFFAEEDNLTAVQQRNTWKVLLVDDEPDIHSVTRLALRDVEFEGKELEILSSYSEDESRKVLRENPNIAVVLLDVVMENDDSGLKLVRFIREELNNHLVRIILRTGQPGLAPERRVIMEYDINDYKEKTELTSQKLFTTVISGIRSFKDIQTIEKSKKGLEKILEASTELFRPDRRTSNFAEAILDQLSSLTKSKDSLFYFQPSSFVTVPQQGDMKIVAATGDFKDYVNNSINEIHDMILKEKIESVAKDKNVIIDDNEFFGCFESSHGAESIIYFRDASGFSDVDKNLLKIFSINVSTSLNNLMLNEEIINTQKELIVTLGEVVESRSMETGHHVKRVAEYSHFLAKKLGLSDDQADTLRSASPMHDIGKIGIPDNVLNKPGKLTPKEFALIKTHTTLGYGMLKNSQKKIFKTAAIVAHQHHERWDGTGYPNGLKGNEIHIYGRITAVCDVFDALSHKRIYKDAWSTSDVVDFIRSESGKMFDPELVDLFLSNIDEILKIKNKNIDEV